MLKLDLVEVNELGPIQLQVTGAVASVADTFNVEFRHTGLFDVITGVAGPDGLDITYGPTLGEVQVPESVTVILS